MAAARGTGNDSWQRCTPNCRRHIRKRDGVMIVWATREIWDGMPAQANAGLHIWLANGVSYIAEVYLAKQERG